VNDPCVTASEPLLSADEALEILLGEARLLAGVETIDTLAALGRVLAAPIESTVDVPPADNSAMDGYAISTADLHGTGSRLRVAQRIPAGTTGSVLEPGTAARIFTGAPVPPGADAVVMQEYCRREGDEVAIDAEVAAGENIRRCGEDIKAGTVILDPGRRLRPQELGFAASVGVAQLEVYTPLRVAIFSTGA